MAVATVAFTNMPSPRHAAAAPDVRVPPRVYSPFPQRRLVRPMAVRANAETAAALPGRARWLVFRVRRHTDRSV